MRWEDEKYVRVYTRDTADWLALSFDAQALFTLLLRKVDRAGILPLGRHGKKAVAVVLGHTSLWVDRIAPALEELLADGCVTLDADRLIVPNFVAAQEAVMSGALRTREWRERSKERNGYQPGRGLVPRDGSSPHEETKRHAAVTSGDEARRAVTPRDSFLAVPSVPSVPTTTSAEASSAAPKQVSLLSPAPAEAETTPPKAKRPPAAKADDERDPRKAEKKAAFEKLFLAAKGEPYYWLGAKDWGAVNRLLAVSIDEWERRAHLGLTTTDFKRQISTVAELGMRWNALAGTGPPANGAASRLVTAPASPPSSFTKGGPVAL